MRARSAVLTLALLVGAPTVARAAAIEDTLNKIVNDLNYLTVDGPVYLAGRLPVMIAGADFLSAMELASVKNFSFGLSLSTALFTSFDRLDDNFQLVPKKLPGVVPLRRSPSSAASGSSARASSRSCARSSSTWATTGCARWP